MQNNFGWRHESHGKPIIDFIHRQCWLLGSGSVVILCRASRTSNFLLSELEIAFTCWSPTKPTTNVEDVFRAFDITLLKSKNTMASSRQWQHKHWHYHLFTSCISSSFAFPTIFLYFPVNFWLNEWKMHVKKATSQARADGNNKQTRIRFDENNNLWRFMWHGEGGCVVAMVKLRQPLELFLSPTT